MFGILRRILQGSKARKREIDPDALISEKWTADFSKPQDRRFFCGSEAAYDAYIQRNALVLGLRKTNCLSWAEDPLYRYGDQVIEGRFCLKPYGGYAAAGFMFRMVDEGTCYLVLVSSKGYFRLDLLRNGTPLPLIGWTEVPDRPSAPDLPADGFMAESASLMVIAFGDHLVLVINSRWAAEIHDSSIPSGRLSFALASYETAAGGQSGIYAAEALLEAFSVDSRVEEVERIYRKWTEETDAAPSSRRRLAETFAAMGQASAALVQLKKGWAPGYRRTQGELLLAGRLALGLGLQDEAEDHIDACIAEGTETPEGREGFIEKLKLLCAAGRYTELIERGNRAVGILPDNPTLRTLLGHAFFEGRDYEAAAAAYDRAFELDETEGLSAKNAANVYELLEQKEEALNRYLKAGRAFLAADNYGDLGTIVPRLLSLGSDSWEAHGLAGKWAFGIEDWKMAAAEFAAAKRQRRAIMGKDDPGDPAILFLQALLLLREGKRRKALPLLEAAAALEPDYPLFRFKLAENRFLLSGNPRDPKLLADLDAALKLSPEDGWVANFAAQVALSRGDTEEAADHLERAGRFLGEVPAIRVNRGILSYLRGFPDQALEILASGPAEDPGGIMANCAGNLLVRSGRYEEADEYYRKALSIAPANVEYLSNRASCLIELGLFGEADEVLTRAYSLAPDAGIIERIAYVAIKKGEYQRAEAACRTALDTDGRYTPALLSLGWIYVNSHRWDDLAEIIRRLEALLPEGNLATGPEELRIRLEELRSRLENALTRTVSCGSCGRTWRVPRNLPPVKSIRLFAMPPDELPAGTCPQCGKTYCIGCAKKNLDPEGRFLCVRCGVSLKLIDNGLKKLLSDWAAGTIPAGKTD
ncbi:MAG: tetratricopeptide repeat protein [Spirochaetaceae bacterium]|jgi:tetratricopeptide (TPR) repeat protein|nr:tetratricopeptide repeat protein [Spirochaetaceae bacterium]